MFGPTYCFFIGLLFHFSVSAFSQNDCSKIYVDLKNGTVNNLPLTATMDQVRDSLSCFTGSTPEGEIANCGGGVFFLNHDFYFYTHRNYVEFRGKFKGELSDSLYGLHPNEIVKTFGPTVRYEKHGNTAYMFYKTSYGCLQIRVQFDTIVAFSMHAIKAKKVVLCL